MPYKDPEKAKIRHAAYRLANREKFRKASLERHRANREEHLAYMRGWRAKNIDKIKDRDLKRIYGISLVEYNLLLESQGGVCAICLRKPSKNFLSVDHCHVTGVIRGLLCDSCNRALGYLKDSIENLERAAIYLRKSMK